MVASFERGRSMTRAPRFASNGGLSPALQLELIAWAEKHDSIVELWLFGSRAKGTARSGSDVDLAIVLAAPNGDHDWAFGAYVARGDRWQDELATIAGTYVSLEAIAPETEGDEEVRSTGVRLWTR